ncbi:hypothetical protein GQ457_10G018570 [Hibiscus cannabinus]
MRICFTSKVYKINTGKSWSRLSNGANTSEEELDRDFFAEFEDKKEKKRKKKAKKFGSLLEIQNNSISESQRRKRDKELKKRNWSKFHMEESELSGKSLSDSDINNRVSKLVNEAKQVLELGKKIGVNIIGDEADFINELIWMGRRMGRLHKIDHLFTQKTKKVSVVIVLPFVSFRKNIALAGDLRIENEQGSGMNSWW